LNDFAINVNFGFSETIVAHPIIVVYDVTISAQEKQELIPPELIEK